MLATGREPAAGGEYKPENTPQRKDTSMGKNLLRRLAVLLILAAAAYLAVAAGPPVAQTPPAASPEHTPAAMPPAPAGDRQPAPAPASVSAARSGQMRLSEAPDTFVSSQPQPAGYTYSLKKEHKEHAVMPGVTFVPGDGVHIKTSDKETTIRITRDPTYPASDYQVMWHKKY